MSIGCITLMLELSSKNPNSRKKFFKKTCWLNSKKQRQKLSYFLVRQFSFCWLEKSNAFPSLQKNLTAATAKLMIFDNEVWGICPACKSSLPYDSALIIFEKPIEVLVPWTTLILWIKSQTKLLQKIWEIERSLFFVIFSKVFSLDSNTY